jgi:hypothetical protein
VERLHAAAHTEEILRTTRSRLNWGGLTMNKKEPAASLLAVVVAATVFLASGYLLVGFGASVALAQSDFYVYPSKGQSKEQQEKDRFECTEWASKETGFNPMKPLEIEPEPKFKGGPLKKRKAKKAWKKEQQEKKATYKSHRKEFDHALKTCIRGRGYTVSQ